MEQASLSSSRRQGDHHQDFNLKEWALKARVISRDNTNSRRFSASNIRSFRELDARSFRSNATISSTASSPGYTQLKDEIDPSNYSFTTALRALQARSGYVWECLSPDGFALNSKWNEAEKYICNPLSGEVPIECLSAKTLSGRSIHTLASRITMSGPLAGYSSHVRVIQAKPSIRQVDEIESPIYQEKKMESLSTRDVGTQSTPLNLSSSGTPSPAASTPSIKERSIKCCEIEGGESPNHGTKSKSEEENEGKQESETEEGTRNKEEEIKEEQEVCKCRQGSCFLWSLWMRKRQKRGRKRSP